METFLHLKAASIHYKDYGSYDYELSVQSYGLRVREWQCLKYCENITKQ